MILTVIKDELEANIRIGAIREIGFDVGFPVCGESETHSWHPMGYCQTVIAEVVLR